MEQVTKKLDELGGLIKGIQDKNDSLEKKHDGLVNTQINEMSTKAGELAEVVMEMKSKNEEQATRIADLEKAGATLGQSKDEVIANQKKYTEQLGRYMRKGVAIDDDVTMEINKQILAKSLFGQTEEEKENSLKSLQVGVNPQGGYWVMPDRSSQVVGRIFESSPMREVSNIITTASESVEMIIDDNEAATQGGVSEIQSRLETATPDIGLLTIHTHEQSAMPAMTQKMLDDAGFDVVGWLNGKVSKKFGRQENSWFVNGDGNLKPKGFLSYADWAVAGTYERDALERVLSGTSADFDADNLIELQNALIEEYQAGASFMMARATWGKILKFKDSQGAYLINPQMLFAGAELQLLGKSVRFGSDMPATAAANANSVAYGDFSQGYSIVDKMGIRVLQDPYTSKPFIKFYTTKRVGGAVTNYEAIKILKEI